MPFESPFRLNGVKSFFLKNKLILLILMMFIFGPLLSFNLLRPTLSLVGRVLMGKDILPVVVQSPYYEFTNVNYAFDSRVNFFHVPKITYQEFKSIIAPALPKHLLNKKRMEMILKNILTFSEKYQIDPFWVTAITWTESHFKNSATSSVGAQGLMQIMPATGDYLMQIMRSELSGKKFPLGLRDPALNIEMGTYYLRKLRRRFRGSYKYATVAYNMGPNWVSKRLRRRGPVGVRNDYLNKVRKYYARLTSKFIETHAPVRYYKVKSQLVTKLKYKKFKFPKSKISLSAVYYDKAIQKQINIAKLDYVHRRKRNIPGLVYWNGKTWRPRWIDGFHASVRKYSLYKNF